MERTKAESDADEQVVRDHEPNTSVPQQSAATASDSTINQAPQVTAKAAPDLFTATVDDLKTSCANPNANREPSYPTTWEIYKQHTANCAECSSRIKTIAARCTACKRAICEDCFDHAKFVTGLMKNIQGCWCHYASKLHPHYHTTVHQWAVLADTIRANQGLPSMLHSSMFPDPARAVRKRKAPEVKEETADKRVKKTAAKKESSDSTRVSKKDKGDASPARAGGAAGALFEDDSALWAEETDSKKTDCKDAGNKKTDEAKK